jgi:hypothetical protein
MKKIILTITGLIISCSAFAEYYKVNVKRIDKDMYKTGDGLVIITKYCYEYTFGDVAILKYDPYLSFENKITFENGSSCQVEKILK